MGGPEVSYLFVLSASLELVEERFYWHRMARLQQESLNVCITRYFWPGAKVARGIHFIFGSRAKFKRTNTMLCLNNCMFVVYCVLQTTYLVLLPFSNETLDL